MVGNPVPPAEEIIQVDKTLNRRLDHLTGLGFQHPTPPDFRSGRYRTGSAQIPDPLGGDLSIRFKIIRICFGDALAAGQGIRSKFELGGCDLGAAGGFEVKGNAFREVQLNAVLLNRDIPLGS